MSEPYIGEIRMFGGNFAPAGWAFCQGQLMPISENDALFNLIGTTYGGDGQETFGLPDLQGRVPVHQGKGPGLPTTYQIGEKVGSEQVRLIVQEMPVHNHAFLVSTAPGGANTPIGNIPASPPVAKIYRAGTPSDAFPPGLVSPAGGSQPHDNMMPFTVINYIISLFGTYPSPT